ncbi:hypothetical protein FOA52_001725 [Chlamydomonas sp. UWO 241]|nr:hypothetical protein FOA52_001725 [Chlamydomonas sp. UWO 241]
MRRNKGCARARLQSPAAKAAIFTGSYAAVAGLALMLAPMSAFGLLFDASSVPRGWIRVGGILFALIGAQYLGTGLGDAPVAPGSSGGRVNSFYRATVWSRLLLAAAFSVLVAFGEAPATLLLLAGLNVVGAASMAVAIAKSEA